jgi:hypothetical protein
MRLAETRRYALLMLKNKNHITKFLALLLIAYGVVKILLGLKGIYFAIAYIFYSSSITLMSILYAVGLPFLYIILIPVAAIVGGVGFYKKKKWGWILSITISLIIFTFHLTGTANFLIASYFYRNMPLPTFPEGSDIHYISMIPTYVITVISFIYILILRHKAIKDEFLKSHRGA